MGSGPPPKVSLTEEMPPGTRALHLFLLVGVGVAQPLYDLLGRNPSFFVAHSATAIDLVVFAAIVSVALPVVLWSLQAFVTRLFAKLGSAVYLVVVAALFAIIAVVPVKRLFSTAGPSVVAVALAIGLAATLAYTRFPALRSVLTLVSPGALLFPVLLLFFSGASEIMQSADQAPAEPTAVTATTPVVLIVFDELPVTSLMNGDRLIDPVAFPSFAELAAHADWFRDAVTVAQNTSYAVPAILTGRYPDATRAPHVGAYPENIFTFLAGSYELRAVETFTRLCPDEINAALVEREPLGQRLTAVVVDSSVVWLHIVLPTRLTAGLPAIDATWRDFGRESDDQLIDDPHAHSHDSTWVAERFLQNLTSVSRPTLFFVHLNVPHLPWKYLPTGHEYTVQGAPLRPHGLQGEMWGPQDWEVIQGWQRHLLQLGYADRLLGRFIDRLRRTGLWNEALVIVTADHGASFRPGESRRRANETTAADILGVPLLIKLPGREDPQIHDGNARTIDILATVADVLDADLPWVIDGRSLYSDHPTEPGDVIVFRNKGADLEDSLELPDRPDAKYRTLERKLAIFGAGKPIDDLYAIGDYGGLVGRRTSELSAAPAPDTSLAIDDAWVYDDVDPDGTFVPAQISGRLAAPAPVVQPLDLAVSVNGTIQAATRTYSLPGENDFSSFSAMVSDAAFASGRNLVSVSLIEPVDGGDPRLAPLSAGTTISYTLRRDDAGTTTAILGSDGRTLTVESGAIRGEVHRNGETIIGMAADISDGVAAESILVFSGSQFLFSADVWLPTPSIVRRYDDPRLSKTGFRFTVPEVFLQQQADPLEIFAVVGSTATEIDLPPAQTVETDKLD
jgi:hypothetical protein